MKHSRRSSERGFTLIEVVVSILIFSIVTMGMTPMLLGSIRGANISRSYNVGKNVASQAMERIRGLPFFESAKDQAPPIPRRDLLDLYFPDTGSGYSAGVFTTTCTSTTQFPAASGAQACPPKLSDESASLPTGYTLTFDARFVKPAATPPPGQSQSFTTVIPVSNYDWDSTATELPPSRLLSMKITAAWSQYGRAKKIELTSLIGERHLSSESLKAGATVNYAAQVLATVVAGDGRPSSLVATAGAADAQVVTRGVAGAESTVRAGQVQLTAAEFNGLTGETLVDQAGAATSLKAPPSVMPAPPVSALEFLVEHPTLAYESDPQMDLAFVDDSSVTSASGVQVVDELPKAVGGFSFPGGTGIQSFWVNNQGDRSNGATAMQLDPVMPLIRIKPATTTSVLTGTAEAEATGLVPTSSRKVESYATVTVPRLYLLPVSFITGEKAVVEIQDFTATIRCTSTANATTASVTGIGGGTTAWTAQLRYWRDTVNNGQRDGSYSPFVALSGSLSGGTDPLQAIKATNPIVYDRSNNALDITLFETQTNRGYLNDWSINPTVASSEDSLGRETTGTIENAIHIQTAKTNGAVAESPMDVTLGDLACNAVDKRGL